ncbi:MAG: hypothetical protein O3B83_03425 [Bacteroidetes bacterium]|jgi:hypothetical protein|nr:hypothetical protein [Bacteroidota bacterium]
MDITRQIHDAENALREFIHQMLNRSLGESWPEQDVWIKSFYGLWLERQQNSEKGSDAMKGKEKPIQFASIEEIRALLDRYWSTEIEEVFEDPRTLDVYLKILDDYRNPDSRRRELLRHQKHLLLGISGDIRSRIVLYRSMQEMGGPYPRIESVRDNLGNLWTPGSPRRLKTDNTLHVGDELEFIITATDVEEQELSYRCHHTKWQTNNILIIPIERNMVEKQGLFHLMIRSDRKHHAYKMGFDDRVTIEYQIIIQ